MSWCFHPFFGAVIPPFSIFIIHDGGEKVKSLFHRAAAIGARAFSRSRAEHAAEIGGGGEADRLADLLNGVFSVL